MTQGSPGAGTGAPGSGGDLISKCASSAQALVPVRFCWLVLGPFPFPTPLLLVAGALLRTGAITITMAAGGVFFGAPWPSGGGLECIETRLALGCDLRSAICGLWL
jgi:hypothetical protein